MTKAKSTATAGNLYKWPDAAAAELVRGSPVSNTLPATPDAAIEPVAGWEPNHALGCLTFAPGKVGRVVLLSQVTDWLGQTKLTSQAGAIEALCEALPPDACGYLYFVRKGGVDAQPVPADECFGYPGQATYAGLKEQWEASKRHFDSYYEPRGKVHFHQPDWYVAEVRRVFKMPAPPIETVYVGSWGPFPEPTVQAPGRPALMRRIREKEGFQSPHIQHLAVPFAAAHAAWGWGKSVEVEAAPATQPGVMTYAVMVQSRQRADKDSPWTDEQREALRKEDLRCVGEPGKRKRIASDLGISVGRIPQILLYESMREKTAKRQSKG